jgi:hypothetical protein
MRFFGALLSFLFNAASTVVGFLFLGGWGALQVRRQLADRKLAKTTLLPDGRVLCPDGHPVDTEGGLYECTRCKFVYTGSIWHCANPECPAPVTPFIHCPICRQSIRNPYRYGGL